MRGDTACRRIIVPKRLITRLISSSVRLLKGVRSTITKSTLLSIRGIASERPMMSSGIGLPRPDPNVFARLGFRFHAPWWRPSPPMSNISFLNVSDSIICVGNNPVYSLSLSHLVMLVPTGIDNIVPGCCLVANEALVNTRVRLASNACGNHLKMHHVMTGRCLMALGAVHRI